MRFLLSAAMFLAPLQEAPDRFVAPGADEPFWISARSVTSDGHLNVEAMPTVARTVLQTRTRNSEVRAMSNGTQAPSADCEVLSSATHVIDKPAATWRDLLRNARAIYRGTVSAVTPGFNYGLPSSMLSVRIDTAIRGNAGFPGAGTVIYFDYAAVDFQIGEERFCMQSVRRDGYLPKAGDEVLVFAFAPPMQSDRRYLPVSDELLLFGRGGLTLSLPVTLNGDSSMPSKARFADLVREAQSGSRRLR